MLEYLMLLSVILAIIMIYQLNRLIYKEKFSVNTIFSLSLLVSFAFSLLNLIGYDPMNYKVFILLVFNILFFYGGGFFSNIYMRKKQFIMFNNTKNRYVDIFFLSTSFLGIIGISILVLDFANKFGVLTIFKNPALLQKNFQTVQYVGYLNTLNILVIPTYVYMRIIQKTVKKYQTALVFIAFIGLILAGNKTYLMFSILSSFSLYSNIKTIDKKLFKRLIIVLAFVIAFFVLYEKFIDIGVYQSNLPWWYSPYNYIAGPWRALGVLIEHPHSGGLFGNLTFYFIYKVLRLFLSFEIGSYIMAPVNIPMWFNVYTFNGEIFTDFGFIGVIIFTFLLGFISNRIRVKSKKNRSFLNIILYSTFTAGLFLVFFVNVFIQAYFIINIIYILLFKTLIRCINRE